MNRLSIVRQKANAGPEEALPDMSTLANQRAGRTFRRLNEDTSGYPRFSRWGALNAITGAMAPDEVWLVGGRQGNGKSLFCQNVFDQLIDQEVPTLYIGTEQSVEVLQIKQSCLRKGISPRWMLKPEPADQLREDYKAAVEIIEEETVRLTTPPFSHLAFFATTDYVNRAELTKWITGGVEKYGIQAVIIDHIDHMEHGEGVNQRAEIDKTIAHVDLLAKEHHIPILVASQIKRTHGDAFQRYSPPAAEDFAESSKKERIASVMLSLWRPLRSDLTNKELRALQDDAKQGTSSEEKIYEPKMMGVRCIKDRLGDAPGQQCMLIVGNGGILREDQHGSEAVRHGITTTPITKF